VLLTALLTCLRRLFARIFPPAWAIMRFHWAFLAFG